MEQYNHQTRLYYDPNSISNFNRYRIVHTAFEWNVDFDRHILHGHAQLDIRPLDENLCERSSTLHLKNDKELPHHLNDKLILDARKLNIEQIIYKSNEISLPFEMNTDNDSLTIDFERIPKDSTLISILIYYSTSSDQCKALQWLTKAQTADRQHPYLFSQCQSILARSLYPCQDTPGVKSTYTAKVTCPKPLTVVSGNSSCYSDLSEFS
jgi:leukotriene-A4 hydrolase